MPIVSEPQGATKTAAPEIAREIVSPRVASVDAYRGFVMLLMMAEVLDFCGVSENIPASGFWKFLCHQQSHVDWVGCSLHDLIQPSFSFLVGVALPFSLARRSQGGQPSWRRTQHAFFRALILVFLGVFLRSLHRTQTYWTFEDTLTQIGLGYGFLYLLGLASTRTHWCALAIILVGYWLLAAAYPVPGLGFDWSGVGETPGSAQQLAGFAAHWGKNTNVAWAFDTWFLNLFPRETPFRFNAGGYCTLSFIPTLGTMILGLIAGNVLREKREAIAKTKWLAGVGIIILLLGCILGWLGICPVVKRIWTPSWVLFSGGWCLLLMSAFYFIIDVRGWRKWAFGLCVIGLNSIAAYCIAHLFEAFLAENFVTHFGQNIFLFLGQAYKPLVRGSFILVTMWLILFWMYRRKIFLRV
jgi:heparan-alpha-glucosaminide N-acetyltransferase